jgi:hypothetical protein
MLLMEHFDVQQCHHCENENRTRRGHRCVAVRMAMQMSFSKIGVDNEEHHRLSSAQARSCGEFLKKV